MNNMLTLLEKVKQSALCENIPSLEDLLKLAELPITDLVEAAHAVTVAKANNIFNFCAIINAKSGRCSENCHWCAQSKHYEGNCAIYPLLEADKIIEGALAAEHAGATRYSLVTSGRKLSAREVRETAAIVRELRKHTSQDYRKVPFTGTDFF